MSTRPSHFFLTLLRSALHAHHIAQQPRVVRLVYHCIGNLDRHLFRSIDFEQLDGNTDLGGREVQTISDEVTRVFETERPIHTLGVSNELKKAFAIVWQPRFYETFAVAHEAVPMFLWDFVKFVGGGDGAGINHRPMTRCYQPSHDA
jgi:hypothetical protein